MSTDCALVYKKDFSTIFVPQMPISSASRNPSCRKDRSHSICRIITNTGIMPKKKGYSGTAIFAKKEPLNVTRGIGTAICDTEGRVITLEYDTFYLVTCYTPNSQNELARLSYRMEWEDAFRAYLLQLDRKKPVILCGDLNVAHTEIDLKNPKTNRKNAGFSDEEREKMTELLNAGFTDTFRYFYPDAEGIYSWWSYRFKAREKNAGWRIDYFITSRRLDSSLTGAAIHIDVFGSDHCPVELTIEL